MWKKYRIDRKTGKKVPVIKLNSHERRALALKNIEMMDEPNWKEIFNQTVSFADREV